MTEDYLPTAIRSSVPPIKQTLPRSMAGVVGSASTLVDVFTLVDRVALADGTVLVTGESGTGKDLVARAVHNGSARKNGPFVTVNCGAFPEAQFESELFGYPQATTNGVSTQHIGRLQAAHGGTLFLDEVDEMPLRLQVKLLRVLQYKEFSPIGDARVMSIDVRIVAATNVDLENAVAEGRFRGDLYSHLNVLPVRTPSLRERMEDIPLLLDHYFRASCARLGRAELTGFSDEARRVLESYSWQGNIRELETTLERAVLLTAGPEIGLSDLPDQVFGLPPSARASTSYAADEGMNLRTTVESFENGLIQRALERTGWNKQQAAALLGINRTTLVEMLKRKGIERAA